MFSDKLGGRIMTELFYFVLESNLDSCMAICIKIKKLIALLAKVALDTAGKVLA